MRVVWGAGLVSFLAQLRQQQNEAAQHNNAAPGLTLAYFLGLSQSLQPHPRTLVNCHAHLTLALVELHNQRLVSAPTPYRIQPQHLQLPPPFIHTDDIDILKQLIDANPATTHAEISPKTSSNDTLRQSPVNVPADNTVPFIQALIDTRIDSSLSAIHAYIPATQGASQTLQLAWLKNSLGEQTLTWEIPQRHRLFAIEDKVFYAASDGVIGCCHGLPDDCAMAEIEATNTVIPPADTTAFLSAHQTAWQALGLPLPRELLHKTIQATVTPVAHCNTVKRRGRTKSDQLVLWFRYTTPHYCTCLAADDPRTDCGYWDGETLYKIPRQLTAEHHYADQLGAQIYRLGFQPAPPDNLHEQATTGSPRRVSTWLSDNPQHWEALLTETEHDLTTSGFVFSIVPGFYHHYIYAEKWQASVTHTDDQHWQLSIQIVADGETISLKDLLHHLNTVDKQFYARDLPHIKLENGKRLLLPAEKINGIMQELKDLMPEGGRRQRGVDGYLFPLSQLNRLQHIDDCLPQDTQWSGEQTLRHQAAAIHRQPQLIAEKPIGVNATLRPYQWLGVCWLQHLRQQNINGLLADDMGLGKTLQTLAHLSLEYQQGLLEKPALIVAPTSLLHNWVNELRRFTPQLSCLLMHGTQRHQHWQGIGQYAVVITSYTLISNDLAHWQAQPLSWVVLDEAQGIKNPRTRNSQSVKQLHSDHRLCLSGTPVENHLGELWSLMDFLMPGCLGSAVHFNTWFKGPIEQAADSTRLDQLLQRIAPFMLRRNKDEVAQDLPPKTVIPQAVSMEWQQRALYEQLKTDGWQTIQAQIDTSENSGQQQIIILTQLLKLRQVCCDPRLMGDTSTPSAKRQHCIDMLRELVDEGRAILVFSQFTQMLSLLAEDLEALDIDYQMLTGKTRKRHLLVDQFQQGKVPVFLISLKAGGVGLNLTRADTVIHYDPWWNSAAEQQATDRAHRIGQDKPVFVYKLIVEDSIESKIAELQTHKALLSQHINQQAQASGEQFATRLDELLALWGDR